MLEPPSFLSFPPTLYKFIQFFLLTTCLVGGTLTLLVYLGYHIYLCVGMCAYCMASREEIAQLEADSRRMWRRRRGVRGVGGGDDDEERQRSVVGEEAAPKEVVGMKYEIVGSREYGTCSLIPVLYPSDLAEDGRVLAQYARFRKGWMRAVSGFSNLLKMADVLGHTSTEAPITITRSPMSRTYPIPSALPTDKAVGFIANLFRSTACIEKAFHQEGGELQYLEECWSDSAVLQFILLGWIGIALKIMLLILLATILGAFIQGRRPWFVFVSCVKGVGRIVRGIFWCFEIDDHVSGRESAGETEKGLGIVWQEEKEGGGYFGSPKEKVLS
ncbi:MAG: hypothetical protein Q9161_007176 [Pseudevernia consocians]